MLYEEFSRVRPDLATLTSNATPRYTLVRQPIDSLCVVLCLWVRIDGQSHGRILTIPPSAGVLCVLLTEKLHK